MLDKYEAVIGLEIHIQLLSKSKAYSSDSTEFGVMPNTNVSVVSLGHPGTLPRVNKKHVEYAVKLGLACQSDIREVNRYARKNYFYADLPKGYQITQHDTPICNGGKITITLEDGTEKDIALTRIHMEEDAGKSMHDQDPFDSLIDLNRAGVPLLELVTEPDIRSSDEAFRFLTEARRLVRYLDICDGNMEEGSMRCDANISVMLKGAKEFGTKVEVKNMNSIRNVQRAIDYEIERQIGLLENGETFNQETRSFDAVRGTTFSLRSKEMANDYRYFPEPDLPPVIVNQVFVDTIKADMPALPRELFHKYVKEYGLSAYDASVLTETKAVALYFEELLQFTNNYKAAANWIMGPVKSYLNENALHVSDLTFGVDKIAQIISMVDEGKVSFSVASQKIFPILVENPSKSPSQIAEENNLIQVSDSSEIEGLVEQALAKYPDKVAEYRSGKKGLVGLFMGEVMKLSKGKADPKLANQLVVKYLEKQD